MTLRRSCDACAKSKLSCDLRTPQCSRCAKKHTTCVYANQPLTSSRPSNVALFHETFHEVSGASETSTQSSLLLLRSLTLLWTPSIPILGRSSHEHMNSGSSSTVGHRILPTSSLERSHQLTPTSSPIQNCIPILSPRSRCIFESLHCILVASGPLRSSSLSCISSDSFIGHRSSRSKRLCQFGNSNGRFRVACEKAC